MTVIILVVLRALFRHKHESAYQERFSDVRNGNIERDRELLTSTRLIVSLTEMRDEVPTIPEIHSNYSVWVCSEADPSHPSPDYQLSSYISSMSACYKIIKPYLPSIATGFVYLSVWGRFDNLLGRH